MPAAETTATFAGIHNENEFYSHHYLSEVFAGDIRETEDAWHDARRQRQPNHNRPHHPTVRRCRPRSSS